MKPFFVYLLRCVDGSYYVGHTDELELRVAKHQLGEVEGYTQSRRPVELVWCQETATRDEALAAEMRIKGWSRAKKEALIRGDWEGLSLLARSYSSVRSEAGTKQSFNAAALADPVRPELVIPTVLSLSKEGSLRMSTGCAVMP